MTNLAESINDLDIKKIQAGDEEASRKFFDAVYPMIRKMVFSYMKRFGETEKLDQYFETEDLVQHALITVFERLGKFQADKGVSLLTWCYPIARGAILDYLHRCNPLVKERREIAGILEEDIYEGLSEVDEETSPIHLLKEAMQKLREKERHILELRLEGMSHKEIAESLGITETASKRRNSRAIQKLRQIIEQEQIEPEVSTL